MAGFQVSAEAQNWKTFLKNHLSELVSVDFFTVATVRSQILFVFVVLEHRRREVVHFNGHRPPHVCLGGTANDRSFW